MKGIHVFRAVLFSALFLAASLPAPAQPAPGEITLECATFSLTLGADGRVLAFTAKGSGKNYAAPDGPPFCSVKAGGTETAVTSLAREGDRITAEFGASGARAVTRVVSDGGSLRFEVVSVEGAAEELVFMNAKLAMDDPLEEPFSACALALNLKTDVAEIPGPNSVLRARCVSRFGMEGAKAAMVAAPAEGFRDTLKQVVAGAGELPQPAPGTTPVGGPWAMDGEINRGSYLFDFGHLTEKTADEWIALAKRLGINQIDFHTGTSLRFGDCEPNPDLFPNGRASVKAVIDRLHGAGIKAGLHTYAFFMAKDSRWVSPVPDKRLGKSAVFTLAADVPPDATEIPVAESTANVSTITDFFVHNSVTLHIDDELVTFTGVTKEAPFKFTGCVRGAHGTKAAAHAAGAAAGQLKECFGLFAPDADSTLLGEVAAATSDTYNECGFDMIYLDALDGEAILGGAENAWHYGSKFVYLIAERLNKPALFEMSTFHHHLWCVRGRMGAWDHPARWHKRFIDLHVAANNGGRGMSLPMNLGWWAVKTWQDGPAATSTEPTYPDDIEYLLCKCIGNGMGFALMGVNPGNIDKTPAYTRLAPLFQRYEEQRHANVFPESVKARLRAPGDEFELAKTPKGGWGFRPVARARHKVQGVDGWSNRWTFDNPHAGQTPRVRIDALMSAGAYDAPEAQVLEDFSAPSPLAERLAAEGVSVGAETVTEDAKAGGRSLKFTAASTLGERRGSWAKAGVTHEPPLNLGENAALGVWVRGDGGGELLNLQYKSPAHTVHGGVGDHYITVDFTGWRYFELVELEGGRAEDFVWPYGGSYATYREDVDHKQVASFSLWYNNLPPGGSAACLVSPVKALPLRKNKIANPVLSIGGKTVRFPVEVETGCSLEFNGMDDCKLYGPDGALLREVTPEGDAPVAARGGTPVEFTADSSGELAARAWVTLATAGEVFDE